jgi:hypothetical protein
MGGTRYHHDGGVGTVEMPLFERNGVAAAPHMNSSRVQRFNIYLCSNLRLRGNGSLCQDAAGEGRAVSIPQR